MSRWVMERAGPGRADPLHGLPSRLQDAGQAAHPARDPAPGAADRSRTGMRYAYTGNVHDEEGRAPIATAAASG